MGTLQGHMTPDARRRAVASSLASVRAEGLKPSPRVLELLCMYEQGEIEADELRRRTIEYFSTERIRKYLRSD